MKGPEDRMELTHLALFGRAPVAGRVKTRLAAVLGDARAAALYRAFLEDVVARARQVPGMMPHLWLAEAATGVLPEALAIPVEVQAEGDLGQRMADAVDRALAGAPRVVVLGTDVPTLPAVLITSAARALRDADVVLGPSADGGYYAIGSRVSLRGLLDDITWSAPTTFAETVARVRDRGLRLSVLSPWYDVDTPSDLGLLQAHLSLDPQAAPTTARLLAG